MEKSYIPSGCAISGIISRQGRKMSGEVIVSSIATMHDRSNGLGGGFAAYGIYPQYADHYAFHVIFDTRRAREETDAFLAENFLVDESQPIPVRHLPAIQDPPILWRYFLRVDPRALEVNGQRVDEHDYVVSRVTLINDRIPGAYVASSGKNMGAFKGVGYPEDLGHFYRLEEYEGYLWTAHGRFPTNTPGWWGGAHPFTLLEWSVVHNGEISSYGINKRYLEMFGYRCTLHTDTEVVAYLFDLLERRHRLPVEIACMALSAPFWRDIERMEPGKRELATAIRQVYGAGMLNGPFSLIIGSTRRMVGFNDRIKLRPMVCATKDDLVIMASEECAIWEICTPDRVWAPRAGEPVIAELEEGVAA